MIEDHSGNANGVTANSVGPRNDLRATVGGPPAATAANQFVAGSLWLGGVCLLLSGLVHVVVWQILGGEWEGAVSWRKPILFGVSTGLTLMSLAWLLPFLKPKPYDRVVAPLVSFALTIEVGLITWQQWRGVPSHFNTSTPLDTWIERGLTLLVTAGAFYIFNLTWRSLSLATMPVDLRRATQSGMVFLSLSCLIGFAILFYGQAVSSSGRNPEIYGSAGVVKFPHGVAIHAIQFFPLISWLLSRLGVEMKSRRVVITWLSGAMGVFLLFSIVQTLAGRARFDVTLSSGALLVVAGVLVVAAVVSLVGGWGAESGQA